MLEHVPGPWFFSGDAPAIRIFAPARDEDGALNGTFIHIATVETEDNARLIAAAPDLFAALEGLEDMRDDWPRENADAWRAARNATSKVYFGKKQPPPPQFERIDTNRREEEEQ